MKRHAFLAAILAAFAAGASGAAAESFHAAASPGQPGYFNARSEENGRWVVVYTGAPGQSDREIAEYALRRAGDIAAEQDQEWFAVLVTTRREVEAETVENDVALRAGHFIPSPAPTFGGGVPAPNVMLERWRHRIVRQQVLVIQLGSGDQASFPGLANPPEIFPATGG